MLIDELFIYILLGIVAGLLSGLLGIGGGIITVPGLLYAFQLKDFTLSHAMQMAIVTSLGAMIFTSASSSWTHYLRGSVNWHMFYAFAPGIIIGSILGSFIVMQLPTRLLKILFGTFECAIGAYFILALPKQEQLEEPNFSPLLFTFIGLWIGLLSTLLGIGGGILMVTTLTLLRIPLTKAISTSSVTVLLTAVVGTLSFLYFGAEEESASRLGYLYLPAFIPIGIISAITASWSAKFAYKLPVLTLRRLLGLFFFGIGVYLIGSQLT